MEAPRYRVVRSGRQWVVLDGRQVVGLPTSNTIVAECAAAVLNRAELPPVGRSS